MKTSDIIKKIPHSKREQVKDNLNFASALNGLREIHNLERVRMCNRFGVDKKDRRDFMAGTYSYTKRQQQILDEYSLNLAGG